MVITALAIVFTLLVIIINPVDGISSYITYIVFYIPCLLIDLAKYLIKEFNNQSHLYVYCCLKHY